MTDKILGFYEKYKTYMDLQENILPSVNYPRAKARWLPNQYL